ncbi:MAG: hypothetical protein KGN78_11025 [Actinomycetales bacterium]|nr:hypothetical protein [Actinomycetales bacterium]
MNQSQGQGASLPTDLLRSVIREVLQDVVVSEVASVAGGRSGADRSGSDRNETVVITSQADLDRAIARVLADAAHPTRRRAIETGRTRFLLGEASARPSAVSPQSAQSPQSPKGVETERIMRGAVTERHVIAAAKDGRIIVIGERVVITPLAKERARATGVEIRRER